MADELIDVIDENAVVVQRVMKTYAHEHGLLHKTVIGYMPKGNGCLLVKQAADRQDAGQFVNPVGGHVAAGETDDEALLRECEEEIGTRNITFKFIGRELFHRQVIGRDEKHMFVVYEVYTEDEIVLNHEAVAVRQFTKNKLKKALVNRPNAFGDALYFILEKFYPDYLPDSWVSRWS